MAQLQDPASSQVADVTTADFILSFIDTGGWGNL
jgi:hypothetical protein